MLRPQSDSRERMGANWALWAPKSTVGVPANSGIGAVMNHNFSTQTFVPLHTNARQSFWPLRTWKKQNYPGFELSPPFRPGSRGESMKNGCGRPSHWTTTSLTNSKEQANSIQSLRQK